VIFREVMLFEFVNWHGDFLETKLLMGVNGEWIDRLSKIKHSRQRRPARSWYIYRYIYEQKTGIYADKLSSVLRAAEFDIVE